MAWVASSVPSRSNMVWPSLDVTPRTATVPLSIWVVGIVVLEL